MLEHLGRHLNLQVQVQPAEDGGRLPLGQLLHQHRRLEYLDGTMLTGYGGALKLRLVERIRTVWTRVGLGLKYGCSSMTWAASAPSGGQ